MLEARTQKKITDLAEPRKQNPKITERQKQWNWHSRTPKMLRNLGH